MEFFCLLLFIMTLPVLISVVGKHIQLKQIKIELNECLGDFLVDKVMASDEVKPHYDYVIRRLSGVVKTHYKE